MTAAEPWWRKRSRPCPFYSQGSCLFSDQCNFLHTVTVKAPLDPAIRLSPSQTGQQHEHARTSPQLAARDMNETSGRKRSLTLSTAGSDSGLSEGALVHSPANDIESFRRSARLSSLLGALRGILDPEDGENNESDVAHTNDDDSDCGSLASDAAFDFGSFYRGQGRDKSHTFDGKDDTEDLPSVMSPLSTIGALPAAFGALPDLLDECDTLLREDSIDSGYAESWTEPSPLALSPRRRSGMTIGIATPGVLSPGLLLSPGLSNRPPISLISPTLSAYANLSPGSISVPQSPFFYASQNHVFVEDAVRQTESPEPMSSLYINSPHMSDLDSPASEDMVLQSASRNSTPPITSTPPLDVSSLIFEAEPDSLSDAGNDDDTSEDFTLDAYIGEESPTLRIPKLLDLGLLTATTTMGVVEDEPQLGVDTEDDRDRVLSFPQSIVSPTLRISSLARRKSSPVTPRVKPQIDEYESLDTQRIHAVESTADADLSFTVRNRADTIRASSLPPGLTAAPSPVELSPLEHSDASRKVPFGFRNSIASQSGLADHRASRIGQPRPLSSASVLLTESSSLPQNGLDLERSVPPPTSQFSKRRLKPLSLLSRGSLTSDVPFSAPGASSSFSFAGATSSTDTPRAYSARPDTVDFPFKSDVFTSSHASDVDSRHSIQSPQGVESDLSYLRPWGLGDAQRSHSSTYESSIPEESYVQSPSALDFPAVPSRSSSRLSTASLATPRPTLFFAIASDDVSHVERVLSSEDVNIDDPIGHQSALSFALFNRNLRSRRQIIRTLLFHGAQPSPNTGGRESLDLESVGAQGILANLDVATKYFWDRNNTEDAKRSCAMIQNSFFKPISRIRYQLIGQDRALEELFKVLGMHSRQVSPSPLVVLCCGPSGHGKSFLARQLGDLLEVATHTVPMTQLRVPEDLWDSCSLDPYKEFSPRTLREFLLENEGKRCVVILDEFEKVQDERILWSLLVPWEQGFLPLAEAKRPIDVRKVIWIGTSNIGQDLIFDYQEMRSNPDSPMPREEYKDLTRLLRPNASQRIGASLLSRVTALLPFVPFTGEEKRALSVDRALTLGDELGEDFSPQTLEVIAERALTLYQPSEGARSLSRAVSSVLLDGL